MRIAFRDAGPGDAAALVALFHTGFTDTFGHLYRSEDLASFLSGHTADRWHAQLASSDFAVRCAEVDGKPVGFAKLGPNELPVETAETALELHQLYVLGPWQGEGLAPVLMDWVLGEARRRGARALFLSVWTENYRARRFYARYGFRFVAPYAFMVGEQADADEIFRLDLDQAA